MDNNKEINALQTSGRRLKNLIGEFCGLSLDGFYLTLNGKLVESDTLLNYEQVHCLRIIPRLLGGKGGFGSMLRAIGAQIEKTTNREACRDLSGRRLRDINEEQRLKNWINQQAEREKEAKEKKKKKLEKLCEKPKHEFKDTEYDKERSALPEMVEDAVLQGLQASTSGCSTAKRKGDQKEVVKKKKPKLWVDDELEDFSSDEGDSEDDSDHSKPQKEKPEKSIMVESFKNKFENNEDSDSSKFQKEETPMPESSKNVLENDDTNPAECSQINTQEAV